jgi:hypothetical protein
MNIRRIAAVTTGVLLTMWGVSSTAAADRGSDETYMGSYLSASDCEWHGKAGIHTNPASDRWTSYRCEHRWELIGNDEEERYALYVKNFQPGQTDGSIIVLSNTPVGVDALECLRHLHDRGYDVDSSNQNASNRRLGCAAIGSGDAEQCKAKLKLGRVLAKDREIACRSDQ